jgi:hypothetical protein
MSKSHSCQTCARLCDEAKDKSLRLEKKVYAMTIALTSALTLLGERAVEEIISLVRGVESITDSTQGESSAAQNQTSAATSGATAPRTAPFTHGIPTESEPLSQTEDKSKSSVEGISDSRKAPKALMDVVNGRIPSMGELVTVPTAPANPEKRKPTNESIDTDMVSYLDYEIVDPNARFVTDSPFGGYDHSDDTGGGNIPAPATVAVLGIVPLIGRRRQR